MPIVWMGWVNAPVLVLANTPFKIKWNIWWLTWPFKKIKLYCELSDDEGVLLREDFDFFPISPIWCKRIKQDFRFGISHDVTFKITVGWRD